MGHTRGIHAHHFVLGLQICVIINLANISYRKNYALSALVDQTLKIHLQFFGFPFCILKDITRLSFVKCNKNVFVLVHASIFYQLVKLEANLTNFLV